MLKDKNISVVYSEELNWYATTLSCVTEKEIKILEQKEHILSQREKEDFSNEWLKVINDNSELRYLINGQVVSCSIDYFNDDIIQRLKKLDKVKIYSLVANLMSNPIIPL